ncbi:hypothetical protein NE237_027728 [Protea cynaroides]|uniref:Uncharacterized protein n=1 Tax=Protea cynaroides TaxID=273540 RepID=A0A9Q0JTA0_9MAGN|nr:hypothetical protein NE237_027728 [Protea cynaroides]
MASLKVMVSSSSANLDLVRWASIYSLIVSELQKDQTKNCGSVNMDELFKNIYGDNPATADAIIGDYLNDGFMRAQRITTRRGSLRLSSHFLQLFYKLDL